MSLWGGAWALNSSLVQGYDAAGGAAAGRHLMSCQCTLRRGLTGLIHDELTLTVTRLRPASWPGIRVKPAAICVLSLRPGQVFKLSRGGLPDIISLLQI